MDPRYEEAIDEIVKGMEDREFTARDVMDTLKRMHPDLPQNTTKPLPDTRKVSEYLRTNPMTEKTGRGHVNRYRYNEEWSKAETEVETCEHGVVEAECLHCTPPPEEPPPEPEMPEGAMTLEEAQAMLAKQHDEACKHPDGWIYQPAAEVCTHCQSYREITEEEPDAIKELRKEYSPGTLARTNDDWLSQMYNTYRRSAHLRDKSTRKGKKDAEHDALMAEGCAEILAMHARQMRKNIRRTI